MEFLAELHPIVVHFPIAFFVLYAGFEIFGALLGKDQISNAAYIVLILGVVTAIGGVLTGNQAYEIAEDLMEKGVNISHDLLEEHEEYATITLWYFFILLVMRTVAILKKRFNKSVKVAFIILSIIGCYFVYETGKHGGELVYKYGVGTELLKNSK